MHSTAAGEVSLPAALPVGLLACLAQLQAPLTAQAEDAAAPVAEAAAAVSDAAAAAGDAAADAAAKAGEAVQTGGNLGLGGYALLLSPIVLYGGYRGN